MKTDKNQVKTQSETLVKALPRARPLAGVCLLGLVALAVSGCGGQKRIDTSNNLKELSLALIAYHDANKAWPEKLEDVKPLIGKPGLLGRPIGNGKDYAALMANPLTGDNPGYEYVKPKEDAPSPATIVLYQLRGGKRDETLFVAFKDASVREAKSPAP